MYKVRAQRLEAGCVGSLPLVLSSLTPVADGGQDIGEREVVYVLQK